MTETPHKSRRAWPGPLSMAGVGKGHTHDLPGTLLTIVRCLVGAVVVLALMVGMLTYYVLQQQQYVEGRGEQRDRENERLQEQIRVSICDLLDQLPEGGLLDRPRTKYGCGSGIPLEDLPEDIRRRFSQSDAPTPASAARPSESYQPAPEEP